MPELCRFNGIVIQMYWGDHGPPHFHAVFGSINASYDIETLERRAGILPNRQHVLVTRWAVKRQRELRRAWSLAQEDEDPGKIQP